MSNQIELRHLRYFLAVADHLHFRRAAESLFISQPGLSRQIKQMEEDLGLLLFERNSRKVKLTQSGLYLKAEASKLLNGLDQAFKHAQMVEEGYGGHLKFGYIGSAMQNVIPNLLNSLRKTQPNISYSMEEMDNHKQIESLIAHEIDLAFIRLEKVPRGIKTLPVLEDTFSLVLPADHELDQLTFKDLSQVKQEPFILFDASYSPSYFDKVMGMFEASGYSPKIAHNSVNASSVFRMVANKFGIAIVPSTLQEGFSLNVKFIELDQVKQRTTLYAAWSEDNGNPLLEEAVAALGR